VHAQDATDTNRVEAAVVDETPDRLGMHAELPGDLPNAVERIGLSLRLE
jgi:hypothetical protein